MNYWKYHNQQSNLPINQQFQVKIGDESIE